MLVNIPNHEGYYITEAGEIFSDKQGKLKQLSLTAKGVCTLHLGGKSYRYSVAYLMSKIFLNSTQTLAESAERIDGNPLNNTLANIRVNELDVRIPNSDIYWHPLYSHYYLYNGNLYTTKTHSNRSIKGLSLQLNPFINKGYYVISISESNKKLCKAHRIIYECYHNVTLLEEETINHKDGNKLNNSIDNLEVLSVSDNLKHMHMHLDPTRPVGSRNGGSKLSELEVCVLLLNYQNTKYTDLPSNLKKISSSSIWNIRKNNTWTHIPRDIHSLQNFYNTLITHKE